MTFDAHYAAGVFAGLACAAVLRPSFRQMAMAVWERKTERLRERIAPGDLVWLEVPEFGWCYGSVIECDPPMKDSNGAPVLKVRNGRQRRDYLCTLGRLHAEPPPYILARDVPRPAINKPIS